MGRPALALAVAIVSGCLPRRVRGSGASIPFEGTYMLLQTFTKDCLGEPTLEEAFNLDLAFQRFGHKSTTCQALPLKNVSYRMGASQEIGACHMDIYSGLDCKTYGRTLPILTGNCLGTHVSSLDNDNPSERRLAEVVAAEVEEGKQAQDVAFFPSGDDKVRMRCSRGPLAKGVFDKTCVTAKEVPLIRQLREDHGNMIAADQHRVNCVRAAGCLPQLRRVNSKKEFEALFEEGGCAASCQKEKELAHHSLVMQNRLDCKFKPHAKMVSASPPIQILV